MSQQRWLPLEQKKCNDNTYYPCVMTLMRERMKLLSLEFTTYPVFIYIFQILGLFSSKAAECVMYTSIFLLSVELLTSLNLVKSISSGNEDMIICCLGHPRLWNWNFEFWFCNGHETLHHSAIDKLSVLKRWLSFLTSVDHILSTRRQRTKWRLSTLILRQGAPN